MSSFCSNVSIIEGGTTLAIPNNDKILKHSNTQSIDPIEEKGAHDLTISIPKAQESATLKESISMPKIADLQFLINRMCSSCESLQRNEFMCTQCNHLFCNNCLNQAHCVKCSKVVCEAHSSKCSVCLKRTCTDAGCINEFPACQICQSVYCPEHFESHKKFNQSEPFKLRCNFERCKITQGFGEIGIEKLSTFLTHMPFLKELRLRTNFIRKQRNRRQRHFSACIYS